MCNIRWGVRLRLLVAHMAAAVFTGSGQAAERDDADRGVHLRPASCRPRRCARLNEVPASVLVHQSMCAIDARCNGCAPLLTAFDSLAVNSVLAIGGVGGLAIGLAGREILENLFTVQHLTICCTRRSAACLVMS
jgi:hypothetical protein